MPLVLTQTASALQPPLFIAHFQLRKHGQDDEGSILTKQYEQSSLIPAKLK